MTTKIVAALLLLFSACFLACDEAGRMMPPVVDDEITEVNATETSEQFRPCDGYEAWLPNAPESEPVVAEEEGFLDYLPQINQGAGWWTHKGVRYELLTGIDDSEYPFVEDYELGDWVTAWFYNTPVESDVMIETVYLCFDANLIEIEGETVITADDKGFAKFRFRLLPKLKQMETIEHTFGAFVIFKNGHTVFDRILRLSKYPEVEPRTW